MENPIDANKSSTINNPGSREILFISLHFFFISILDAGWPVILKGESSPETRHEPMIARNLGHVGQDPEREIVCLGHHTRLIALRPDLVFLPPAERAARFSPWEKDRMRADPRRLCQFWVGR